MEPAGCFTSQVQMRNICFGLLLFVLPILGACATPVHPRYQPATEDSIGAARLCKSCLGTVPQEGYSDYQIDARTYLVTYQGFNPAGIGPLRYLSHEEWIEMAHSYVLYRSAELARSKGVKQFVILHRDDSNQSWRVWKSVRDRRHHSATEIIMGFHPGARVLIRFIDEDNGSIAAAADQLQVVDTLMTKLIKSNAELARHQGVAVSSEDIVPNDHRFIRWRVPVLLDDTGLEPTLRNRKRYLLDAEIIADAPKVFKGVEWNPPTHYQLEVVKRRSPMLDTNIIEDAPGVFKVAQWSRLPLSPIDLLKECIKITDREGYPAFKLEDWITEEYRPGRSWNDWNDWDAWFRVRARLVLLRQSELNSLDPVFVVNEIRNNVMR